MTKPLVCTRESRIELTGEQRDCRTWGHRVKGYGELSYLVKHKIKVARNEPHLQVHHHGSAILVLARSSLDRETRDIHSWGLLAA